MKIESQETSFECSKILKELGVKQDSLYHHFINPWSKKWVIGQPSKDWDSCSAFTSNELMELLPNRITLKEGEPFNSFRLNIMKSVYCPDPLNISDIRNLYIVNYECDSTHCTGEDAWLRRQLTSNITDEKFADALAKMLIYILENKLMELPK